MNATDTVIRAFGGSGLYVNSRQKLRDGDEIKLSDLVNLPFKIRSATVRDIPELIALECICWPENLRVSDQTIANRVNASANESEAFVATKDGNIVGVIYTQRINSIEALLSRQVTFSNQDTIR